MKDLTNPLERARLARDPNTPTSLLAELAKDAEWQVRLAVAAHPRTPVAALVGLLKDRTEVQEKAVRNPSLPPEVLLEHLPELNRWLRRWLAGRRETPEVILRALAQDEVLMVREAAQATLGRML